jgi:hypothetical protein
VWLLLRRPLLLLFSLGCLVSFLASGQLTARLVLDGMVSFAFVPAIQLVALAAAFPWRPRPLPFSAAADLFFAGSIPWLLTFVVICAAATISSPVFWSLTTLEIAMLPALSWSLGIDFRFFRDHTHHTRRAAARALVLQRLIGWSLTVMYFLGIAIWAEILPQIPWWPIP